MKNSTAHKFYHTSMAVSSHSSETVTTEKGGDLNEDTPGNTAASNVCSS
jgi:hypothetical protein